MVEDTLFTAYKKDISRHPRLSKEEEMVLGRLVQAGNKQARKQFIEANLALVVHFAMRWTNRGLPIMDLIQEGNIGMIRAVDKFDPDNANGASFGTYGAWWIRQGIQRALLKQATTIRVPVHVGESINVLRRKVMEYRREHDVAPSDEWVMNALKWNKVYLNRVREAQEMQYAHLDMPIAGAEDCVLGDTLESTKCGPHEELEIKEVEDTVQAALDRLRPRQASMVAMRYGIEDGVPRTLHAVGQAHGVTRERIRQVELNALDRLRRNPAMKEIST